MSYHFGNPHGLLYTGDPDLPLEDSYPFIGMAGMGLGGLLTRAAMKTPVRALMRKEPTLPKVTIKSKRPISKNKAKRRKKQSKKDSDRWDERNQEYLDSGGEIESPIYELARMTGRAGPYTKRVIKQTKDGWKKEEVEIPLGEYLGRLYTKGHQRQRIKGLRKRMSKEEQRKRKWDY
jgi:hypothetical protein